MSSKKTNQKASAAAGAEETSQKSPIVDAKVSKPISKDAATELVDRHFATGHDTLFDICKQAKIEVAVEDWNHESGRFAIGKEEIVTKYIAPALAKWKTAKK